MTGKWLNISLIEDFFFSLLNSKELGKVVVGKKLPDTLNKDTKRITLIDLGRVRDRVGYVSGVVIVFLFSKSADNGEKNVPVMAEMEEFLRTRVADSRHEHYIISRGSTYPDYDSTYDMHCNVVEINLTII